MKERIIYTPWLANDLISQGFILLEVRDSSISLAFCYWVFKDTFALRNAIEQIFANLIS